MHLQRKDIRYNKAPCHHFLSGHLQNYHIHLFRGTMPRSATLNILASGSLFMAMMFPEVCMSARCWILSDMPNWFQGFDLTALIRLRNYYFFEVYPARILLPAFPILPKVSGIPRGSAPHIPAGRFRGA